MMLSCLKEWCCSVDGRAAILKIIAHATTCKQAAVVMWPVGHWKGRGPGLGWGVLDPFQVQILLDTNFVSNSDRQAKAGGRRATRAYQLRQFDLRFTDDWNDEAKPRSGMRNFAPY